MPVEHLIDWVRVVRTSSDAGSDSAHVLGHGFKARTSSDVSDGVGAELLTYYTINVSLSSVSIRLNPFQVCFGAIQIWLGSLDRSPGRFARTKLDPGRKEAV